MLTDLQARVAAPLFPLPVPGFLDRGGYERLMALATGGRLVRARAEQRYYDIDYGALAKIEASKTATGYAWVDGIRISEAVRQPFADDLYHYIVRYDPEWVQAIFLVPVIDLHRALGLAALEEPVLAHAGVARSNSAARTGWPRGHTHLHRTVEDRDLYEIVANGDGLFSGRASVLLRDDHRHEIEARFQDLGPVFDSTAQVWR